MRIKIISVLLFVFLLCHFGVLEAFADENVNVYINGNILQTDQSAIIYQDRTMVPLRSICEELNCNVKWDDITKTAIIENEVTIIAVQIENYYMSKKDRRTENGETKTIPIDVPPIIVNDRTLVPARAISEALNATVSWDGLNKRVDIFIEYDWVSDYHNGYALVSKDGKHGFIDKQGNIIIPIEYDNKYFGRFSSEGLAVVSKGSKVGVLNDKNEFVIPMQYDYICDPTWGWEGDNKYMNGIYWLKKDDKWGCADRYGNIITPIKYNEIEYYSEDGLAGVMIYSQYDETFKHGYIDYYGNEIIPMIYRNASKFCEGIACVQDSNGNFGYIDTNGNTVIPFIYDWGRDFSEGVAPVKYHGKWGVVNRKGQYILKPNINCDEVWPFESGIAIMENNINVEHISYGFITKDGYESDIKYSDLFIENGEILAEKNGKYGYIDAHENTIIPFIYDQMDIPTNDLFPVMRNEKYGVVNRKNEIVIPLEYDSWINFDSFGDKSLACKGDKVGVIDIRNNVIVPFIYDYAKEDKYLGTILIDETNKTYVDLNGKKTE